MIVASTPPPGCVIQYGYTIFNIALEKYLLFHISIVKNFEWEHASIIISIQLKWSKEIVVAECIGEGRVHNILINITHYVRMISYRLHIYTAQTS